MAFLPISVLALLSLVGAATPAGAPQSGERVDVALVLAGDVSGSMTAAELRLQRDGFAAAFRNPALLQAIRAGTLRRIAVAYVDWAGPGEHWQIVPWTIITDQPTSDAFADRLAAAPIVRGHLTSLSDGLLFAAAQFAGMTVTADRMTIDVSGDGPNNAGPAMAATRDLVVGEGITVNGLPLGAGKPDVTRGPNGAAPQSFQVDLDAYFSSCVIGGEGAFTMPVATPPELFEAIQRKLILEIAAQPARLVPAAFVAPAATANCDAERDIQYPP